MKSILEKVATAIMPPPKLTVTEWADTYRFLSSESSAEPGKWSTHRAEYLRYIMDAINNPLVKKIVFKKSARVGGTEVLMNAIGYFIHYDPCPILYVHPTVDAAESWSKDSFAPMLRDTPVLSNLVKDSKSRSSGNTILHKQFPGGQITAVGANSPVGLRAKTVRVVILDEVDAFPVSAGAEGDPVELAIKRSQTFWNRKILMVSTPTIKGISKIDHEYEQSRKHVFQVPCPHCSEYQELIFENLKFTRTENKERIIDVWYECAFCGKRIDESHKMRMVRNVKPVIASGADIVDTWGFSVNQMYSAWSSWKEIAEDFLASKKLPEKLRVWVNTTMGEAYDSNAEQKTSYHKLLERVENYEKVPIGCYMLTAAADIQGDRIEYMVRGWGRDYESWLIDFKIFYGNPEQSEVWEQLNGYLMTLYERETGEMMNVKICFIDSGDRPYINSIYKFTRDKKRRRIYASKGGHGWNRAIISRPTANNTYKAPLFTIGVDSGKEIVQSRLQIKEPGAGYMHFNNKADEEYFKQLTAEKIEIVTMPNGQKRRQWKKVRDRNEALDLECYAYAALEVMKPNWNRLARDFNDERQKLLEEYKNIANEELELKQEIPVQQNNTKQIKQKPYRPGGKSWLKW